MIKSKGAVLSHGAFLYGLNFLNRKVKAQDRPLTRGEDLIGEACVKLGGAGLKA